LREETIIVIIGIAAISILEIINLITLGYDGNILSAVVGSIVYLVTRTYYKTKRTRSIKQ
jgi:hypothetical protein